MAERSLNTALKKRLINNEPFVYAHLIKYERPHNADKNGKHSTDAKRYAYLTDGEINISFNDGSYATDGTTANGAQTYIANKISKIGSYSETVEAKATSMTLSMSAETLYNSVTSSAITMTSSTITVPSTIDLVKEGFREGDKISITGGTNNGHEVRITGIKTNNTVLTVSNIDSTLATQNTGTSITLKIESDEIKGPLTEMNDTSTLKSYHNRDVFVYKAFLDPDDYSIIGAPILIFKGIIASATIIDNPNKNLEVQWKLTSHWGDFAQVNGRPTNDAVHRAIDENGKGQPEVALKDIYANDYGFQHADVTLSTMSTYKYMEKVPDLVKKRKGIFGLRRKYELNWVEEERTRDVDLNWHLSAKYLPVVYGVDRVDGIPIFVDTENDDPTSVYVAYAICEGEIGGIYDFYFDDHPRICLNLEDSDARSTGGGESEPDVVCIGRADLGTVLGGKKLIDIKNDAVEVMEQLADTEEDWSGGGGKVGGHGVAQTRGQARLYNTQNAYKTQSGMDTTADTGILHEETHEVDTPNNIFLTFHAGKTWQRADDTLAYIANSSTKFKRQTDYFEGGDYWGPAHMLSDTAYVVTKTTIGEDDETVPEIKYVVRGKLIDCYNYDFSYRHNNIPLYQYGGGEAELADGNNAPSQTWNIGDTVDLKRTDNDSTINSSVVIIDKWTIVTKEGEVETRFRFSSSPNLSYTDGVPSITSFYMQKSSNKFHFVTSNHIENSGTVPSALTGSGTTSTSGGSALITFSSAPEWVYEGGAATFPELNDVSDSLVPVAFIEGYNYDGNSYCTKWTSNGTILTFQGVRTNGFNTASNVDVIRTDAIKLATSASTVDNQYNGMRIKLTSIDAEGDYTIQEREIVDYDGSTKIAQVDRTWDKDRFPKDPRSDFSGYTYKYEILAPKDVRVSTNPSIQLLDYMTSETYGKRLDKDIDIELGSWLTAARTCDDTGTQKVYGSSITATVGDRYVLTSNGNYDGTVIAMGKVKSTGGSGANSYIEFEEVHGKFSKTLMYNNHNYVVGDIICNYGGYYRVGTAGVLPTATKTVSSSTTASTTVTVNNVASLAAGQHVFANTIKGNVTISSISGTTVTLSSAQSFAANSKIHFCSNLTQVTSFNIHKLGASDNTTAVALTKQTNSLYDDVTEYSIYNSDFIRYWRHLGWESHHQRWATRHQLCTTVDTSSSVFNNINGMLQQFNGILSFEAGKYVLRIEAESDDSEQTSDIATSSDTGYTVGSELNSRYITNDDIIGTIKLSDPGPKKSYNTVSSTIADPGSKFEGKQVSFYDSNFLKIDKNVIKSGNFTQPAVHSYYNARINVENYLKKSRYQMKVNFTLGPKGLLLVAGDVISLTYDKFGWSQKQFRIENLNFKPNCTVDISASEYNDSFYSITPPTLESNQLPLGRPVQAQDISAPTNFSASAGAQGEINLSWKNASKLPSGTKTEIWVATGDQTSTEDLRVRSHLMTIDVIPEINKRVNGGVSNSTSITLDDVTDLVQGMVVKGTTSLDAGTITISSISGNTLTVSSAQTMSDNTVLSFVNAGQYTHYIGTDSTAKTYWIRHTYTSISGKKYSSPYTTRQVVTTVLPDVYRNVTLQSDKQIFVKEDGSLESLTIKITPNITNLDNNIAWTTSGDVSSSIDLYTAASGGSTTTSGTSAVYLRHSEVGSNTTVSVTATITENSTTYAETVSFPVIESSTGTAAKTVRIRSSNFVFLDDNDGGTNPDSPDFIKLEAVKQNTTATANWTTSPSVTLYDAETGGNTATSGNTVYMRKADYAANTNVLVTLTCDSITDTVSIVRLKTGSGLVQAVLSNENHVLPAATDGAVSNSDAAGSGTTIRVYQGSTALNFTTGTPAAGEWAVSVGDTNNITEGGVTDSGSYATIADHTGVATGTDTYTITYTISGKHLDGTSFSNFTASQYLTKAKTGAGGSTGRKVAELVIYYNNTFTDSVTSIVAPNTPTTGTYNFSNATVASLPTQNSITWSQTKPSSRTAGIIYQSEGLATESSTDNTSNAITWSTPSVEGLPHNDVNWAFKRAASQPTSLGTTNYPSVPTNWYDDIGDVPSGSNEIWVTKGTTEYVNSSGTITYITTWQDATQLEGTAGTDGTDGTTIDFSNEAHTIPTDVNGNNGDYTGSGTDIKVLKGTTALAYGSSNSQFTVSASASNITAGSASTVSTNTRRYAVASSMTADTATITFTIAVKDSSGNTTNYTKVQTFSKSKQGVVGDEGKGTTTVYLLNTGFGQPSTPSSGTDETPGSWTTTVPTAATGKVIWFSLGTKPAGSSTWTFTTPQLYWGDLDYGVPQLINDEFSFNLDNLSPWTNSQVTVSANGTLNYDGTTAVAPSLASIAGTVAEAQGGTGLTSAGNAIVNSRVKINADGTLAYDNTTTGAMTMNTIADANNIRSRITTGLTSSGVLDTTVPEAKGGTGLTSAGNAIVNAKITTNANGTLNYDGTSATAPSLASITGIVGKAGGGLGEDISSATGVLRMASGTLNKDSALSTTYTDATDNGTTIDTSGNITGNMSCGATVTLGTSSGNKIVCGNVTIDGETGRILITD